MANSSFRFVYKITIFLFLILSFSVFAADNTLFFQKIEWKKDPNAFYYRVEIAPEGGGKSDFTKTERNFLEIKLAPGKYRYRVYAYDFLEREASRSGWTSFEIFKANKPEILSIEKEIKIEKDARSIEIFTQIKNISVKSTVELVSTDKKTKLKGKFDFSQDTGEAENGTSKAVIFSFPKIGKWVLHVENPSGLFADSDIIEIKEKFGMNIDEKLYPTLAGKTEKELEADLKELNELKNNISNEKTLNSEKEKDYQAENSKTLKELNDALKELDDALKELDDTLKDVEKLKKENEDLKNKPPVVESVVIEKEVPLESNVQYKFSTNEIGYYVVSCLPISEMNEHANDFLGGGFLYRLHVAPNARVHPGFVLNAELKGVFANTDYISEWFSASALGGLFLQFNLGPYFKLVPEVKYGIQADYLKTSRAAEGLYLTQTAQGAISFKISPSAKTFRQISIELEPFYTLGIDDFSEGTFVHYAGGRLGLSWHFQKKIIIDGVGSKKAGEEDYEN